ncbi:MAG TPA: LiaF domain-containing protein [Terriglobia bacterium]|nr:LiaF domain-containing protein [Terriglobia bacterium]
MREIGSRNSGREVAGLIIVLIGFGLLMNTMDIMPAFPFFWMIHRFWVPALFIGIGVLLLSRGQGRDRSGVGVFFILLGLFFLIGSLGMWGFGFKKWIGPAILIWIGIAMLMKNQRPRIGPPPPVPPPPGPSVPGDSVPGAPAPGASFNNAQDRFQRDTAGGQQFTDSSDFIRATVILGSFNRRCPSQQFRGGDLAAIMGGGKIDLRGAQIQGNEAVLDVFVLMGGLEIQVPETWAVEPRFTPVLGGYDDRTHRSAQTTQRLVITGGAIMSGITILN